jgi:hypothetical protein
MGCGRSWGGHAPIAVSSEALSRAVTRGLAFLATDRSDPSASIVLDYLRRRYDLPAPPAGQRPLPPSTPEPDRWRRFEGAPAATTGVPLPLLTARSTTEDFVLHALYCDTDPLQPNFAALLQRYLSEGRYEGYELTHAALALKLIDDNRCALPRAEARAVWSDAEVRMRRLLRSSPAGRDVAYEALAILQDFYGARDLEAVQIATVLAAQHPDGGWSSRQTGRSAPHPTVMATWVLLGRLHPDSAPNRFARR